MGSLMKKQAERFLREKKRHRRWLAMFLCLALAVTSGTFAALRMNGHAMDHGGKILNCRLRVHAHSDECFDGEGKMICGQADYAVHTHDARCHNDEGELVCQLPEREAHVHDSACYAEEKVLTCKEEETAGHQHSPECYIEEPGELVCSLPEHEHSELCYDELGNPVCGQAAHYHDNSCYAVNEVLICGQEEGQGGHAHTDACYETQKKLTCGEPELHTHDRENCYDANGNLTCGKLELQEHEHGEGCFEDEEIPGMDIENEEYLADGEPDENAPEESASDNAKDPSEEQASENSVSGDSVSQDAVSENSVSENGVSENSVSENSVSDNSVSENSISENSVSGNGVSENSVSENKIITLETKVDGTTISLSGPQESFNPEKEYEIEAKAIKENSKEGKQIKKAIDKAMEKEEGEAEKYRAFDIKLMSGGEEVQPKGAVSVNFVSKDIEKSVADENTEVSVFHVDDKVKKAEDMEAETTEEGTVTMETTHFSIYVVVDLNGMGGGIEVELEHWGRNIKTISANDTTDPYYVKLDTGKDSSGRRYGLYTKDEVYDRHTQNIKVQNYKGELYRPDFIKLENELKDYAIEDLSKIFLGMGDVKVDPKKYQIDEIWISDGLDNKGQEEWETGTYNKYEVETNSNGELIAKDDENPKKIYLRKDSVIRFWYKETAATEYVQETTFYDYNLSNSGKASGADEGINTNSNFKPADAQYKMGMGQDSSGNKSSFAGGGNGVNELMCPGFGFLNQGNKWSNIAGACSIDPDAKQFIENDIATRLRKDPNDKYTPRAAYWAVPVKGLVKDLTLDYKLQFAEGFKQPGYFEAGTGKIQLNNYSLGFQRTGDTYVLSTVKRNKNNVLEQLEKIRYTGHNGRSDSNIYSNNFFPLDSETSGDAKGTGSDDGKDHNWHFGMQYSFYFNIGDYTGPMNYYFRGDDDFWLFVDGKKVVDLGGIHSSVGHAVDLRQWMDDHDLLTPLHKDHRIDVFYMERGGFGSCCYMQFTLPNCIPASSIVTENHVNVTAEKKWVDYESNISHESIYVELVRTASNGIQTRRETQELNEENGWKYTWEDLPTVDINNQDIKYTYQVEESSVPEGYISKVENKVSEDKTSYTYIITNTQKTTDISVKKEWQDGDDKFGIRPSGLQVRLKADGKVIQEITLNAANKWSGKWQKLPIWDVKKKKEIVYEVEEVNPPSGYIAPTYEKTVSDDGKQTSFVITNTLDSEWQIQKRNKNNPEQYLEGAEFTLTLEGAESPAYTGKSEGNDGVIKWAASGSPLKAEGSVTTVQSRAYTANDKLLAVAEEEYDGEAAPEEEDAAGNETGDSGSGGFQDIEEESSNESIEEDASGESANGGNEDENTGDVSTAQPSRPNKEPSKAPSNASKVKIQPGSYILAETKAPAGFALSEETWTVVIAENGVFQSIRKNDEKGVPIGEPIEPDYSKPNGIVMATFYFDNEMFYELPETGGIGTYWYTISGMLLMMGASLILYKNRRRQAVRR